MVKVGILARMEAKPGKEEDNARLSHIFLYDYEIDNKARGSEFIIIGRSVLPKMMGLTGGTFGEANYLMLQTSKLQGVNVR